MKVIIGILLMLFSILGGGSGPLLYAQEDSGVQKFGVIYNIAEDRQIEKIGGVNQPEGLDKYMKRKFDALQEQINALDRKIAGIEEKLEKNQERLDAILEKLQAE